MADAGSRKERWIHLDKQKLVNCGRCKPNRGDNAKRKDRARKERLRARKAAGWQDWTPKRSRNGR